MLEGSHKCLCFSLAKWFPELTLPSAPENHPLPHTFIQYLLTVKFCLFKTTEVTFHFQMVSLFQHCLTERSPMLSHHFLMILLPKLSCCCCFICTSLFLEFLICSQGNAKHHLDTHFSIVKAHLPVLCFLLFLCYFNFPRSTFCLQETYSRIFTKALIYI